MYQYSLTWFLRLFHHALDDFRGEGGEPDNTIALEELVPVFTYSLYQNVCRSLFEKDKLLFSFMLAVKVAQADGHVSAEEYDLLIKNQECLHDLHGGGLNEWASWLPNANWQGLCLMA
jgi:dynein heavy chain